MSADQADMERKGRTEDRLLTRFCFECLREVFWKSARVLRCNYCCADWTMVEDHGKEKKKNV